MGRQYWEHFSSCRARLSLVFLATPLLILSCGTAPQGNPKLSPPPRPVSVQVNPQAYYHFLRGYMAELANNPREAIAEYRKGLRVDPDSAFLKLRIATLHFSNSEMSLAVEMANAIPLTEVEDVSHLMQLARVYAGTGHSKTALSIFDRVIAASPGEEQGYVSKGMLLLGLKRTAEAKVIFETAIAQVPRSSAAHYYLGITINESGEVDAAEQHFKKAIELRTDFRRAYQSLASLHEDQKKQQESADVYEQYLREVNPHDKEFRLQLVRLYLIDHSYENALKQLALLAADHPDDLNIKVRTALIYGEMGNYQQAIDELTAILQARPNELRVRDYLGLMYEEQKDFQQAIDTYQANLKINPQYYDSLLHLGFLSYRQKQYPDAVSHLEQAKHIHPKRSEPYLLLGLTYLQQEDYESGAQEFEEGIQQDPTNADLHFNLGTAYDKLDRFDDVVQAMQHALKLEPEHADALNYLGYSYADRGVQVEQALKLTQRAVKLKPNNGYYIDSLGWALFKVGRSEEALATINHALSLIADDPVIFEHLGEIYLQRDELDKAQKAWARSLELDSSNERLIKRFRDQGFGEPTSQGTLQSELPKVSHSASEHSFTP
ncbi:tetratricopeptide repeat protein [Nitrospira sp. M1]